MKTYKQFILEKFELRESNVGDPTMIRKKRLIDRTPKEQAFMNSLKANKPKPRIVHVHIGYENGEKSKDKFKVGKHDDANEVAKNHFKHMEFIHSKFPNTSSKPVKILKVEVKEDIEYEDELDEETLDEALEDNTLYIKKHDDGVNIKHKSHSISLNNDHINHLTSMDAGSHIKHGDWNIKKMKSSYVFTHPSGSRIKLHKNEVED